MSSTPPFPMRFSSDYSRASGDLPEHLCPTPLSAVPDAAAAAAFFHTENRLPQHFSGPRPALFVSQTTYSEVPDQISQIFSGHPVMTRASSLSFSGDLNPFPAHQDSFGYPMSMSSLQHRTIRYDRQPSWRNVLPSVQQIPGHSSSVFRAPLQTPSEPEMMRPPSTRFTPFSPPTQTPLQTWQTPQSIHPQTQTQTQTHLRYTNAVPLQSFQQEEPWKPAQPPLPEEPAPRPINNCSSFPVKLETPHAQPGRPRGYVTKPKMGGDAVLTKCECSCKFHKAENSSKEAVVEQSNTETPETRRADDTPRRERQAEDVRGLKRNASDAADAGYEAERVVIEVNPGENIAHKIASFAERNNQRSIVVFSATGSVKKAVISPLALSQVQVIEGEHEIVSLSGAFALTENESEDKAGFMTVTLRRPSGTSSSENGLPRIGIIAGILTGSLIAASHVKVYLICISRAVDYQKENKSSKRKMCAGESSAGGARSA